jgi:hypothetical protein
MSNILELTLIMKEGCGPTVTLKLPADKWQGEVGLQRYTGGCLARGDSISVEEIGGKLHNFPASTIARVEIVKKTSSEAQGGSKKSFMEHDG